MANNKGYKRSWRNYLLDSNYQLRFTFTMLAVAAGLMAPLGWWVSQKAQTATEVALNQIDEIECPEILSATPKAEPAPVPDQPEIETDLLDEGEPPIEEVKVEEGLDSEGPPDPADIVEPGEEKVDADPSGQEVDGEEGRRSRPRPKIKVEIDDSNLPDTVVVVGEIEKAPPTAEAIALSKKQHDACQADVTHRKNEVRERQSLITTVLVISAIILLIGLGVYGIKTTHRVAGPLFKVGLYLGKLENNIYDKVYNLRKGDQLVEFYEHFKGAHAGLTTMQTEDRDRLKDALALAKEAGLADKSAEMKKLVAELEVLLKEKEESLGQEQA